MNISNIFNDLGIQATIDYGQYQSIKGKKGDFVDFLLSYDAKGAKEGSSNWLSNVVGVDENKFLVTTGKATNFLNKSAILPNIQKSDYFDTQVTALKYQLLEGFKTRIENSEDSEVVKSKKVTALYDALQSIEIPSRFKART